MGVQLVALPIFCLVIVLMTTYSTLAKSFPDTNVNGFSVKQDAYLKILAVIIHLYANIFPIFFYLNDMQKSVCSEMCGEPEIHSLYCLRVYLDPIFDVSEYQQCTYAYCGYVPGRTCLKRRLLMTQ